MVSILSGHRGGRIQICPELWYVVGALLGDGYLYRSSEGYLVGLDVRSKEFAEKFASKQSVVVGRPVRAYYYNGNRIWFVRLKNLSLYFLIWNIRSDPGTVLPLIRDGCFERNAVEFLEGFFDAEGCVKIVKESARRTAKVCLDLTSTSRPLLDVSKSLIEESLGIVGHYSLQLGSDRGRKTTFHLRIYSKSEVRLFLESVHTFKFTPTKRLLLERWLALG